MARQPLGSALNSPELHLLFRRSDHHPLLLSWLSLVIWSHRMAFWVSRKEQSKKLEQCRVSSIRLLTRAYQYINKCYIDQYFPGYPSSHL